MSLSIKKQNEQLHEVITAMAQILHVHPPEGYSVGYVAIAMMSGRTEDLIKYLREFADKAMAQAEGG